MGNLKNDKRGFVFTAGTAIFFIILIAGLAGIISFLSSTKIRIILIGIGVLLAFVWLVGQQMKSNNELTRGKIIILVLFLFVGLGLILSASVLQEQFSSDVYAKPLWGNLHCTTDGVYENDVLITTQTDGSWIDCGEPGSTELVNECKILINNDDSKRVKYYICTQGGSCGSEQKIYFSGTGEKELVNILSGQTIFIRFESTILLRNQPGSVIKRFDAFKLVNDYGGIQVINSQNCNVPIPKDNILNTDLSGEKDNSNCATKVLKGDYCNYVVDWFYGPGTNVVNHPQYGEVYCTGNKIYDIVEVTTANNKIVKLDPTYQGVKADGNIIKGLGDFKGLVDCCPTQGNPYCNSDFIYITNEDNSNVECQSDVECINDFQYYNPKLVRNQICVNNECIWQSPQIVICANDQDCGNGEACQKLGDPLNWKCVTISESEQDTSEKENNDNDNEKICKWYQDEVPAGTIEDCGSLSWRSWTPFIDCETKTYEASCKTATWIYLSGLGVIFILVIIIVVVAFKPKKGKKGKKK